MTQSIKFKAIELSLVLELPKLVLPISINGCGILLREQMFCVISQVGHSLVGVSNPASTALEPYLTSPGSMRYYLTLIGDRER